LQLNLENVVSEADSNDALPAGQARLLALLGDTAEDLDSLVAASQLPVATVLAGLSSLELLGRIARSPGGYVRC